MEKIPMTEEGQKKLLDELKHLKTVERPIIIKAIADARSNGDLSENAEYHAAREKQSFIEGRVAEIESIIAQAELIDVSKLSGTVVKFGATVSIINLDNDKELRLMEADSNGSAYVGLKGATDKGAESSYTLSLPAAAPTAFPSIAKNMKGTEVTTITTRTKCCVATIFKSAPICSASATASMIPAGMVAKKVSRLLWPLILRIIR